MSNHTNNSTMEEETENALSLEAQLCFSIYSAMLGINKVYRPLLEALNLTYPQYLVMLILWEKDGINVSEICQKLFLETTTVTPLLKRLADKDIIERRKSQEDERQVLLFLTEKGRALKEQAKDIPSCVFQAMDLPLEDLKALRGNLQQLRQKMMQ